MASCEVRGTRQGARSALTALALTLLTCSGCSQQAAPSPGRFVRTAPYGPVPVSHRAPRPSDLNAAGIQIRRQLEFEVNAHRIVISARDWNSITGSSSVPLDVG